MMTYPQVSRWQNQPTQGMNPPIIPLILPPIQQKSACGYGPLHNLNGSLSETKGPLRSNFCAVEAIVLVGS